MATSAKTKMFCISIGFWLILGVECYNFRINNILTVKTGGSVTIPCHYDEDASPDKNYWKLEMNNFKIYPNATEENLSVIDHPGQNYFTVTMRNLQDGNTGPYSCVSEGETNGRTWFGIYELLLRVQPDPDVSVENSSVSGHEGGNVSVQGFYKSRDQDELKRWCRYKDMSCYSVTDTSQNSSVQIRDDGRGSFTVLMTGLRLNDSGWYFFSAGPALNPVHLTVTEAEPVTTDAGTEKDDAVRSQKFSSPQPQRSDD